MVRFALRRLLDGVVLIFAISTLSYLLLYLGGGNIARTILGPTATEETVALKTAELGLDQPLIPRYLDWLSGAIRGDFGRSWFTSQPVTEAITSRLAVTLSLVIGTVILSAIVAVVLGVWAARKRGLADRVIQVTAILGFAIPNFLIAILLVRVFALNLGWFKPTGYVQIGASFTGWLATVTLPILALSVGAVAAVAQQVRGSVIDALRQDWVRTLRSRGIPENRVVYKHVLRNAGGPALAVLAVQFVGLLGGAVIVEQIFAIPGLGQVSVLATSQGDIPLVMGLVVAVGIVVVIVNLVMDLLQGFLNPKVRLS
ncbi:ABC transporter permease [Demequina sp. SYSU T00039]|uniref:ABC transporter permease n=1 Tax=Demequina lignilytica TaxID=3051663 RepID=A0AAW7MAP3_9MICO|nr:MULTISPECIES: ABC transporter permease [unclassified Demequina]MDN4478773.1 ABC transporter permease [Demequina sp. SYSU T00039-1]MDN4489187.1 ABC transporter permease [Demequina sp. SYSU T00039]